MQFQDALVWRQRISSVDKELMEQAGQVNSMPRLLSCEMACLRQWKTGRGQTVPVIIQTSVKQHWMWVKAIVRKLFVRCKSYLIYRQEYTTTEEKIRQTKQEMMVHAFSPSTWEAEMTRLVYKGNPGIVKAIQWDPLSVKKEREKKNPKEEDYGKRKRILLFTFVYSVRSACSLFGNH